MQSPEAVVPFLRLRATFDSLVAVAKRAAVSDVSRFRTLWIIALLGIGYYAGSKIGFLLTPNDTPISTFWPPNAILLSGFLLTPARIWWVLLLTVLPVHLLIQLQTGIPILTALGWFVGNTGEALVGALCIRMLKKESRLFESVRGMFVFLTFGVLLAPVASSFVDSASAIRIGEVKSYWLLWETRLSTNMVAILSIVPIIVTLGAKGVSRLQRATLERYVEAGVLGTTVIILSFFIFSGKSASAGMPTAFVYVPLLVLLWAALRFGAVGLSASILGAALISGWEAVRSHGEFGTLSAAQDMLSLHILLAVFAFPLMLATALIAERRNDLEMLELTRRALIDAHEQYRQRIARELHTYIAGQLTLVGLGVDELRGASSSYTKPILEKLYDQISSLGNTILRLTHRIHPFNVEYLGLARALTKLCRDTGAENGIAISSLVYNLPPQLPIDVSLRLFRIAQLALECVLERRAKRARLELTVDAQTVVLRVIDAGASSHLEGAEMLYMREHALSLGGTFETKAGPQNGLVIEVSIPISICNRRSEVVG